MAIFSHTPPGGAANAGAMVRANITIISATTDNNTMMRLISATSFLEGGVISPA